MNVNVANKLDSASKGTTLYSPIFGTVIFQYLDGDDIIVETHSMKLERFDKYGRYDRRGKQLLFPNEQTDDWSNFFMPTNYSQGDILYYKGADVAVMYDNGYDDATFEGKHYFDFEHDRYYECMLCVYDNYVKADKETIKRYEAAIARKLGKKFCFTELESIFKPFDKVVVRDEGTWHIDFFERYLPGEEFPYEGMHQTWQHCLPFNEETAKLIGTKDDYIKEGYECI